MRRAAVGGVSGMDALNGAVIVQQNIRLQDVHTTNTRKQGEFP